MEVHLVFADEVVLFCSCYVSLSCYSDQELASFRIEEGCYGFQGCQFYVFVWLVGVDVCSQRGFEFSCF